MWSGNETAQHRLPNKDTFFLAVGMSCCLASCSQWHVVLLGMAAM